MGKPELLCRLILAQMLHRHNFILWGKIILVCSIAFFACNTTKNNRQNNSSQSTIGIEFGVSKLSDSLLLVSLGMPTHYLSSLSSSQSKHFFILDIVQFNQTTNERKSKHSKIVSHFYYTSFLKKAESTIHVPIKLQPGDNLQFMLYNYDRKLLHTAYLFSEPWTIPCFILNKNSDYKTHQFIKQGVYTFYNFNPPRDYIYISALHDTTLQQKEDTLRQHNWVYRGVVEKNSLTLSFEQEGVFVFYGDSLLTDTLFVLPVVSEYFPENNTPYLMLNALKALESAEHIDSLLHTSVGCKIELDKKWLLYSQNNELRAKKNIAEYYSRVAYSNQHYQNYNFNFLTDRALAYILCGKPRQIIAEDDRLKWVYTNDTTRLDKMLQFTKTDDAYSLQYMLDTIYQPILDSAKKVWRDGKIFNFQ